jgi:hypothetical protein
MVTGWEKSIEGMRRIEDLTARAPYTQEWAINNARNPLRRALPV